MTHSPARRPTRRHGSTLIELMVVVVITGILASMAIPSFAKAVEQTRVDQAAATLRTIWTAQRFYKMEHGVYAANDDPLPMTAMEKLQDAGLLEPQLEPEGFRLHVDAGGFPVRAECLAGPWSGSLEIDAMGIVRGEIVGHGYTLRPSFQFIEADP
jgi:prepilin-type N-terminal cleavage/methylation domain-containing protein